MKFLTAIAILLLISACASKTMQGGPMNEAPVGLTGTMTIVNHTKMKIENVLITRCNDRTFAARRNDEQIEPGGKYTFKLIPGCWVMRIGNRTARHSFGVIAEKDFIIDYRGN